MRETSGQVRKLCPEDQEDYNFIIKGMLKRGKRLPSSRRYQVYITSASFILGRRVSDPVRSSRIIIAFIQISRRVVTFFFHLMAWGISCAFIYGYIVK